ncbi:hypothetical protein CaCOL14_000338 [Colletotrichum acutatum]
MIPIICQVVNADHKGLAGMRVNLEYSGAYQFSSSLESVTGLQGLTSSWTPRQGYGGGTYGYGGFAGWSASPRITVSFMTERFFCNPTPWSNIQTTIDTHATGSASHHVLLRFSRDRTSYQIVHTSRPLTPPVHGERQTPEVDWNADLCTDLPETLSPSSDDTGLPDTPSSLNLPSPLLASFGEHDNLMDVEPRSLKRKASLTESEGPPRKRRLRSFAS